jgi:hypothetical protein
VSDDSEAVNELRACVWALRVELEEASAVELDAKVDAVLIELEEAYEAEAQAVFALAEAVSRADELEDAGTELADTLRRTVATVEGYTGPPVWWHAEAEAALARWFAAARREEG